MIRFRPHNHGQCTERAMSAPEIKDSSQPKDMFRELLHQRRQILGADGAHGDIDQLCVAGDTPFLTLYRELVAVSALREVPETLAGFAARDCSAKRVLGRVKDLTPRHPILESPIMNVGWQRPLDNLLGCEVALRALRGGVQVCEVGSGPSRPQSDQGAPWRSRQLALGFFERVQLMVTDYSSTAGLCPEFESRYFGLPVMKGVDYFRLADSGLGSFDVVFGRNLHPTPLKDMEQVAHSVRRVLNSGGVGILEFDNTTHYTSSPNILVVGQPLVTPALFEQWCTATEVPPLIPFFPLKPRGIWGADACWR